MEPTEKNTIFMRLDGQEIVLDDVHGVLRAKWFMCGPGRHELRLLHEPSAFGRSTRTYRDLAAMLGSGWVADLTDRPEVYLPHYVACMLSEGDGQAACRS